MIVVEAWDLNVTIFIWGGMLTEADQDKPQQQPQPRVWPAEQKKDRFDVQKHKEVLLDVRQEFVDIEVRSTFEEVKEMPKQFQPIFQKNVPQKVSKLKSFLESYLMLIQDKYAIV